MFLTLIAFATMLLLNPARTNDAKMQRYPRLQAAGQQDRILIIAPHIDDESIGAGGYAIDALANGADVYVVFLTAGDCNRFSARLMYKTFEPTTASAVRPSAIFIVSPVISAICDPPIESAPLTAATTPLEVLAVGDV